MSEHELSPREVSGRFAAREVQVVDVREQDEWNAGRIEGALHIPMNDLATRAGDLDHDRPVVFYCRSGGRSAMATEAFRAAGFTAWNMTGGLAAWKDAGLPLEPEDGEVHGGHA